jgi:hypothetical protein
MKRRWENLRRIESLDPATDYDEIFRLTTRYEFPWDYTQGTSIAFLRDYGVPSISALLDATGEFEHHGQKRYDDTILIGYEGSEESLESDRGRAAVRHLNRIHGHYDIPNDEFIYVLATTIVGPKRWIDAFGWRDLHPHEVEAMARVTTRLGELMGIKGLPSDYPGYESFLDDYEATHFRFEAQNLRVTEATLKIFTDWYPRPVRPILRQVAVALLDPPLRDAIGLDAPPPGLHGLTRSVLRLRARALRHVARPRPVERPYQHRARTYPFGYTLDGLGPAQMPHSGPKS